MNRVFPICVFCCLIFIPLFHIKVQAQQEVTDSIRFRLSKTRTGKDSIQLLSRIGRSSSKDSGIYYLNQALKIAQRLGDESAITDVKLDIGFYYRSIGDYVMALQQGQQLIHESEVIRDTIALLRASLILNFCYSDLEDTTNQIFYRRKSLELYETGFLNRIKDANDQSTFEFLYHNLKSLDMKSLGKLDSSIYHIQIGLEKARRTNEKQWIGIFAGGMARSLKGDSALPLMQESWQASLTAMRYDNAARMLLTIADYYNAKGQADSALHYSKLALQVADTNGESNLMLNAYRKLFELYKPINRDSAYQYLESMSLLNDSLYGKEEINRIQSLNINERSRLETEANKQLIAQQRKAANSRFLFLMVVALLLLAIAGFFYQNNRSRKKSHRQLEIAYDELKSTQSQLIQSEKMASLGELTAGIAHEIQNPLNFVNNFSDVNRELLAEMRQEIEKKNFDEVSSIAKDVEENEEKIIFHGKRADTIVKGMLQHSRQTSGIKEPTDVNALCDEYLRLAYHGLRAKDKSFNAKFETEFDNGIQKINIVPQEIGRVVLNLISNAFYAVNEKVKQNTSGYEPTVTVSTKKMNGKIEISVKDNGNGIPDAIKEKIFQPFFTTKPTGSGTGLGLSLSYDIVKAHGGELKVETKEGEGSEFIIQLPII